MSVKKKFLPVRGNENIILNMPYDDECLYFATDTKRIFMDANGNNKIPMGGGNSGIFYGIKETTDYEDELTLLNFSLSDLEGNVLPDKDDLILNSPDGCFYRVTRAVSENEVEALRLTVAGNGTGPGGKTPASISFTSPSNPVFVEGQDGSITITPYSAKDKNGNILDNYLELTWKIVNSADHSVVYASGTETGLVPEKPFNFEFGSKLSAGTSTVYNLIEFTLSGYNSGSVTSNFTVQCVKLLLTQSTSFLPTSIYNPNFTIYCNVTGQIAKILEVKVDNTLIATDYLEANNSGLKSWRVEDATHGVHKIKISLYQDLGSDKTGNDRKGVTIEPLEFEIAVNDGVSTDPIIWTGDYKSQYNNYDKITIPYLVYNPRSENNVVRFYKNTTELSISPKTVVYNSNVTEFETLEIIDATAQDTINSITTNTYYITCGNTEKKIQFDVLQTGRMILEQQNSLLVNFDSAGRSNNESSFSRSNWSFTNPTTNETMVGTFNNFNWYNNGWIIDNDGNSCLRISNGASFEIPIGQLMMNSNTGGKSSYTFEFQFKVRNIQNYEKLISLVTRYYLNEAKTQTDEVWYENYMNNFRTTYDTYDQFLQAQLPLQGLSYDDLVYRTVESTISAETALCNYFDGTNGFCLGTQDAFFKTNVGTLNVNYVEDRIINLTLVYSKTKKLAYIYLNGVLSGAAVIPNETPFTIGASTIRFNSDYCDIDLYKVRAYNIDFAVREVLNNYAIDLRDIQMYNESNALAIKDTTYNADVLDYDAMVSYNVEHPDEYLMPYIQFRNVDTGALPYNKYDEKNVDMLFVNTGLDHDYTNGTLIDKAKNYKTGKYRVAWVTVPRAEELITEYSSNSETNYYIQNSNINNGNKIYLNLSHEIIRGGSFKVSKSESLNDDETINYAKSYIVEVWRTLDATENYYLHHGASFTCTGGSLKTQGTSSQFYPRRNYKLKAKGKMIADRGPFERDPMFMEYFFMDNDNVGTTKFTMKIDYMESSGSYNTGLANLVANAYTKHPLFDYSFADDLDLSGHRTSVQGFPAMAFHKKADGSTIYIGRYNINIDKGSDEAYGYKLFVDNDPQGSKINTPYVQKNNKAQAVAKVAECWEFSDNNRGFCSFRDPLNRNINDIGDNPGDFFGLIDNGSQRLNAAASCPVVADSFEYRYNSDGDMLDYLYNPADPALDIDGIKEDYEIDDATLTDQTWRNEYLFNKMKHWEKAVKWVYSTDTDSVDSEETMYATYAQRHDPVWTYVLGDMTTIYDPQEDTTTDALLFNKDTEVTIDFDDVQDAVEASGFTEESLKARYGVVDTELSTDALTYYTLNTDSYCQAYAAITGFTYVDYEIEDDIINCNFIGGDVVPRSEVMSVIATNTSDYATSRMTALSSPRTIGKNTYYFDTQEYRLAKFANEFDQHFDKEYTLIYFIVTEVMMAYDSRGKNCMMASWGPQRDGGEYIWYPVFYDLDTQLGINNTGIPSFEYYVNASKDGCYSTNDSVLWNNIYKCFFDDIKKYYQALRTSVKTKAHGSQAESSNHAPFAGIEYQGQNAVEHIENWYTCQPESCKSICMQGRRPLIAINEDEYYKYIFIMDNNGPGYQGMSDEEPRKVDAAGSFLYALQGDRSLSRQQFLTRRINFVDSWLTRGNYSEGTGTTIKFRTSANDPENTSDIWVDNSSAKDTTGNDVPGLVTNAGYYKTPLETDEFGDYVKLHDLDADFFIKLTPFQRSYVTLATDNAPLPSTEYTGSAVKVNFPTNVVTGVQKSPRYAEQLLYVYGADYLKDIGDISLLYPREFELTSASHLQRIILGSDEPGYKNWKLKSPKFDAETNSTKGKPLLKEVVFTNVKIDGETLQALDFGSAEKLQIFRALGMNLSGVTFANGVALHTLHLPSTIATLTLREARQLTNIITNYETPTRNADKSWNAQRGLYIQGLTDAADLTTATTSIDRLEIAGGGLNYGSYDLLKSLYTIYDYNHGTTNGLTIGLTDVNWTPYTKLEKGYAYNSNEALSYYKDNEHYQLENYVYTTAADWEENIKNGLLYIKNENITSQRISTIDDDGYAMLKDLAINSKYYGIDTGNVNMPVISGNIYVDNDTEINESEIKNIVQSQYYPDLNIFVKTVKKAYSAKFVKINDSDGSLEVIGTQKVAPEDTETMWFSSPYELYSELTHKDHYDFYGWSTTPNDESDVISAEDWDSMINANQQQFTNGQYEYVFYIVYKKHQYKFTLINDDGVTQIGGNPGDLYSYTQEYNSVLTEPTYVPTSVLESGAELETCYKLIGWTTDPVTKTLYNFTQNTLVSEDVTFYAVYEEMSVHDPRAVLDEKYFYYNSGMIGLRSGYTLSGKITIPKTINGQLVTGVAPNGFSNQTQLTHVFWEPGAEPVVYDSYAFSNCGNNLKYVEMPESVEVISSYAFASDSYLLSDLTESQITEYFSHIQYIDQFAFLIGWAVAGKTLKLGPSLQSIGRNAFQNFKRGDTQIELGYDIAGQGTNLLADNVANSAFTSGTTITKIVIHYNSGQLTNAQALKDKLQPNVNVEIHLHEAGTGEVI